MAKKVPKNDSLKRVKEIFLSKDLDDDEIKDNLELINSWEQGLRESDDFENWQTSDITKSIAEQAKKTYKEISMKLMENRSMTDEERKSIYARQDAMLWILSMVNRDVKGLRESIHSEIEKYLKVV